MWLLRPDKYNFYRIAMKPGKTKKKERKKDRERRKKKTQGTMKIRLTKHNEAYEYLHRNHWSWDRENNSVFYLIKRSILFS